MTGTLINCGAIAVGSLVGVAVGSKLPDKMRATVMSGLSLVLAVIGAQMAFETKNVMVVLGAILIGSIVGELLRIQDFLEWMGERLQERVGGEHASGIAEGFVVASLVFCVGPMAILGSIQDGISGDFRLLSIKATLDGVASVAFSASLGWGVALSSISILLYQGAVTLFAAQLSSVLTEPMIQEMTATGGVIIVGIAVKLLDIKDIRLANMLPALAMAPVLTLIAPWIKALLPGAP